MFRIGALVLATAFLATAGISQQILSRHYFAKPVVVDITKAWTSTGIKVAVGDTIEIMVKGVASTQGGTDRGGANWYGPEGDGTGLAPSFFNAPGVAPQSVIGKIGSTGTGFYVGSTKVLRANVADSLFLGYNDDPTRAPWPENFGYYVAFIINRSSFGR